MIGVKTGGQNADRVTREIGAEFGGRFGRFYEMVGPRVFRPFPARDIDQRIGD